MMKKNKKSKYKSRDENKNTAFEERKKFCPFSQKNSPTIDYKSRKLSEEFFVQMDECGSEVYSNVKQILSYSGN